MKYFFQFFIYIIFLFFYLITTPSIAVEEDTSYKSLKNYMDHFYNYNPEKKEVAKPPQPPRSIPVTLLPRDKYGLIDWAAGVRSGIITPLPSLNSPKEEDDPINLNVFIKSKKKFMTDVRFPHNIHTYWLSCKNCHPGIFIDKAGGNPEMTMWDILKGEYCGRCHGKVAFPLTECYRCHMERTPQKKAEEIKNE